MQPLNPDLKTCKWAATFHKTINRSDGKVVDMWLIHDDESGEGIVSIAVPHGRKDIVEFVVRSCAAGQRVLSMLRPGEKYAP